MTEFTIRLTKKGSPSGIFIDASTVDNNYEFQTVQFAENVDELYKAYINQRDVDYYTGPSFNSLDERLQAEIEDFLKNFGISEELMGFINIMAMDRDQQLYLQWLKNVKGFFSH